MAVAEAQAEEGHIHMPNPSYYPLVAAIGLFLLAFGLLVDNPHIQLGSSGSRSSLPLGFLIW